MPIHGRRSPCGFPGVYYSVYCTGRLFLYHKHMAWSRHGVFAFGKTLDYAGNKVAKMRLKAAA